MHIPISTLFKILFPYGSLQSVEKSSLCCKVDPYSLSTLTLALILSWMSFFVQQTPTYPLNPRLNTPPP